MNTVFTLRRMALLLGLGMAAGAAQAQSAGSWLVKGGINNIAPQVKSGDLSAPSLPGTKVDVKAATSVIFTAAYMVTDAMSVEVFAGLPYEHDVQGDGAVAGAGKLGSVKQVSPTVLGQYRFLGASDPFRPYVGAGLTYGYFYGEEGSGALTALTNPGGTPTRLSVDSALGFSVQAGGSFKIDERWFIDGSVIKTFVKTTATLSTGQAVDTKLDPLSINLSVGYRF
jgi:outer membrane protein